jgi:hypothetical protein
MKKKKYLKKKRKKGKLVFSILTLFFIEIVKNNMEMP